MKKLKSAEEYLKTKFANKSMMCMTPTDQDLIELIKQVQLDAIEAAVERCANEVDVSNENELLLIEIL